MSKQTTFDKVGLLGVDVDAISTDDAIEYLCQHATPGQPSCYVTKPYVEFLDRAYRNPQLQDLLNHAELTIPDGVALVWAAHYLYAGPRSFGRFWSSLCRIILSPDSLRWPLPDRAAGINFTWPLLEAAASRGLRVFIIASPRGSDVGHTAATLHAALPGLTIIGTLPGRDPSRPAGQVSPEWLDAASATIAAAQPDLILVGMGFPLQEQVCAELAGRLPHGVFIGEGGTFDYERFGGQRAKAPAAIQRIGLEWLWRLVLEPRRLGRQLAIPRFIWRIWRSH